MNRGIAATAFLAALALAPAPARADVFDALAISAAASDVVTTELALRQGFVESNIQNRGVRVGANVALTSGMLLVARELQKSGHKGSARALKIATALTWGYIAARNIRTMQGGL